eukprot:11163181-Lingulodinium_polyedra.AAC.1
MPERGGKRRNRAKTRAIYYATDDGMHADEAFGSLTRYATSPQSTGPAMSSESSEVRSEEMK